MGERNKEACGHGTHTQLPRLFKDKGQSSNLGSQVGARKTMFLFSAHLWGLLIPGTAAAVLGSHETVHNLMSTTHRTDPEPIVAWSHAHSLTQRDQDPDATARPGEKLSSSGGTSRVGAKSTVFPDSQAQLSKQTLTGRKLVASNDYKGMRGQ